MQSTANPVQTEAPKHTAEKMVFSILLAAAFLSEGLRPVQTLGIVLVLSAIVIVQLPGRSAAPEGEAVVVEPIE